ncbi:MAG: class I SAM-dependent methyltransferase, partial [Candidatus Hydrogenedentes bacterium]|nr:class I SAM-dependent methyltransferase [Candidatus Hydrogenedentota bacterium]
VRRELAAQLEIERRGPPPDHAAAAESILRLPDGNPDAEEHAPLVRYAVPALCPNGNETVLDLGAGLGWTSAMFARAGCRCVLVDIYSTVLEAGRCFAQSGAYFHRVLADMSRLPLRPAAFDAVFANAAIHHTPDLDATLREAARVLKPGGRIMFVNEPVVGRWERRRPAEFGADYRKDGICERAYTTGQWRSAFRQAGLIPDFKILDVGFDEKIRHRAAMPAYAHFPKKQALALLRNALARRCMLSLFAPIALELYPLNVILAALKVIVATGYEAPSGPGPTYGSCNL